MNKYKTVNEFLLDLDPPTLQQVELLRSIITTTEPMLQETIKWNAPNYVYSGEDRITFNLMNKQGLVKLVLHMGATKVENRQASPILKGYDDLIIWNSDIRGVITCIDFNDIKAKQHTLARIISEWLKLS